MILIYTINRLKPICLSSHNCSSLYLKLFDFIRTRELLSEAVEKVEDLDLHSTQSTWHGCHIESFMHGWIFLPENVWCMPKSNANQAQDKPCIYKTVQDALSTTQQVMYYSINVLNTGYRKQKIIICKSRADCRLKRSKLTNLGAQGSHITHSFISGW